MPIAIVNQQLEEIVVLSSFHIKLDYVAISASFLVLWSRISVFVFVNQAGVVQTVFELRTRPGNLSVRQVIGAHPRNSCHAGDEYPCSTIPTFRLCHSTEYWESISIGFPANAAVGQASRRAGSRLIEDFDDWSERSLYSHHNCIQ